MAFHDPGCAKAHDHSKACNCGIAYLGDLTPEQINGLVVTPYEMPTKKEAVDHPQHYGGDTTYEAIKVIVAWQLDFCLGNAVKYIARAGEKDPTKTVEDLRKAAWYLNHAIENLSKKL